MIRHLALKIFVATCFAICGFFFVGQKAGERIIYRKEHKLAHLWSTQRDMVYPVHPSLLSKNYASSAPKIILFWTKFFTGKNSYLGVEGNRMKTCPVSNCIMTDDQKFLNTSSALIFHPMDLSVDELPPRNVEQYWIYFVLESPPHVTSSPPGIYNLTFTYRLDSDIIADNYLQFFNFTVWSEEELGEQVAMRAKPAAVMFASNCVTPSGRRFVVEELSKYFPVDVFGFCSKQNCPKEAEAKCDEMVKTYKFYLAFENSICKDYVTEKVIRAFKAGVVPVVYGGANYSALFPPNSFINAMDYKSPEELAKHLHLLSTDTKLYQKYLAWRTRPEFVKLPDHLSYEKVSLCRLCELLHRRKRLRKSYADVDSWFAAPGTCQEGNWTSDRDMSMEPFYSINMTYSPIADIKIK